MHWYVENKKYERLHILECFDSTALIGSCYLHMVDRDKNEARMEGTRQRDSG
jgi:hypothetical protein